MIYLAAVLAIATACLVCAGVEAWIDRTDEE